MDNINDRKTLLLLTHLKQRNNKQQKTFDKLSAVYTDNEYVSDILLEELIKAKFITKSYKTSKSTGAPIQDTITYQTTNTGAGAIYSGRFPSEMNTLRIQRWNIGIGWFSIMIGAIGGLFGIVSTIPKLLEHLSHLK